MSSVTIKEIAEALGLSKRAAEVRAAKAEWRYEIGRGKGAPRLYDPVHLPGDVREALVARALTPSGFTPAATDLAPVAPAPSVPTPVDTGTSRPSQTLAELKGWQKDIMNARLVLVREIERQARTGGKIRTIDLIVEKGNAGTLAPELQAAVAKANAKQGDRDPLNKRTLLRWCADFKEAGNDPLALAPSPSPREQLVPPAWLADFLDFYALPSKPSVPAAVRECAKHLPDLKLPSIRTIQWTLAKMPAIERARGRLGPRALRQLKAFVRRDVSEVGS